MQLSDGERRVGELAAIVNMPLPAMSKHLKLLEESQLINKHKHGRQVYCQLSMETWLEITQFVSLFSPFWQNRLEDLTQSIGKGML